MSRDPSGIYTVPAGTDGIPDTTIESAKYNGFVHDVEQDLNTARPIVAGGTGATSASQARDNLDAEVAMQTVTNYGSHTWEAGSFKSAAGATGAPEAAGAYVGIAQVSDADNIVVEARNLTDNILYVRKKTAGTWGAWQTERAILYAAPLDAMAFNGMQINGNMEISQELGLNVAALTTSVEKYLVDGWSAIFSHASATVSASQSTAIGSTTSLRLLVGTAMTTLSNGDVCRVRQHIEGWRVKRLQWGTANASPITITFTVYSVIAGTAVVRVSNGTTNNRFYYAEFTVAAGTFQHVSVTIPGDTTGTWDTGTGAGMTIVIIYAGKSATVATPGVWGSVSTSQTTNNTNLMSSASSSVYLWNFVVLPGTQAPTAAQLPLIMRPADQELFVCHRYFQRTYDHGVLAGTATGTTGALTARVHAGETFSYAGVWVFSPEMRIVPTIAIYSPTTGAVGKINNNVAGDVNGTSTTSRRVCLVNVNNAAVISPTSNYVHVVADARL